MTDYKEKFEKMRIAGNLAARTLDMLTENIKEGVSTDYIDKLGYEFIRDNGGYSAPLYYRGFTKSLCTSLNHVVCHGIPSDRILQEGDAVNVDVTAIVDEHYGDTSRMFCIGKTPVKLNNLIALDKNKNSFLVDLSYLDLNFRKIDFTNYKQIKTFCTCIIEIGHPSHWCLAVISIDFFAFIQVHTH